MRHKAISEVWRKAIAGPKYDRCVAKVKQDSPGVNPHAVCTKTVGREH